MKMRLPALADPLLLRPCWPSLALFWLSPAHCRPLPALALAFSSSAGLVGPLPAFLFRNPVKNNENACAGPRQPSASAALPAFAGSLLAFAGLLPALASPPMHGMLDKPFKNQ